MSNGSILVLVTDMPKGGGGGEMLRYKRGQKEEEERRQSGGWGWERTSRAWDPRRYICRHRFSSRSFKHPHTPVANLRAPRSQEPPHKPRWHSILSISIRSGLATWRAEAEPQTVFPEFRHKFNSKIAGVPDRQAPIRVHMAQPIPYHTQLS